MEVGRRRWKRERSWFYYAKTSWASETERVSVLDIENIDVNLVQSDCRIRRIQPRLRDVHVGLRRRRSRGRLGEHGKIRSSSGGSKIRVHDCQVNSPNIQVTKGREDSRLENYYVVPHRGIQVEASRRILLAIKHRYWSDWVERRITRQRQHN